MRIGSLVIGLCGRARLRMDNNLPQKPTLRSYIHVITLDNNKVLLKTALRTTLLRGKSIAALLQRLLPLLNGNNDVSSIVEGLKDIDSEIILRILHTLYHEGFLKEAHRPPLKLSPQETEYFESQMMFFSQFEQDGTSFQELLKDAKVVVLGLGGVGSHVLTSLVAAGVGTMVGADSTNVERLDINLGTFYTMEDLGKTKRETVRDRVAKLNPYVDFKALDIEINEVEDLLDIISGCNLLLLTADCFPLSTCRIVDKACLERRVTWLQAYIDGLVGVVGPTIIPYQTACYTCYELRKKANLDFREENTALEKYLLENPNISYSGLKSMATVVGGLAALEAVKVLTGFSYPVTYGRLLKIDFLSFDVTPHEILKIPRCPSCGVFEEKPKSRIWDV
jgi:thiazole/oxazole-forming peptide maturase SagC family component